MPNADRSFAAYLRTLAMTVAVGVVAALALVVVIDPYRLYRVVELPGVNREKPHPGSYQDEIKVAQARAAGVNALIMGNSRAESGLDPASDEWKRRGLDAYNLAIAGAGITTARTQLDYLIEQGRTPRLAVLGIEFFDFLADPKAGEPGSPRRRHPVEAWQWRFETLFSLASIGDALATLAMQRDATAETMTERGFNPLAQYVPMSRREGYYAFFRQRAEESARSIVRKSAASGRSPALDAFRALLEATARNRIETHVVIYPYHAQLLAMLERSGLSDAFAQWKAQLAAEIDAVRATVPEFRVLLWDFSGYEGPRCEPIPQANDRTTDTQWYWEGGHFKRALGERVLSRVLRAERRDAADGFGVMLATDNLAANQARIAAERATCRARNPGVFSEAAEIIDAARGSRRIPRVERHPI
jgi:hypothetical protein